MLKRKIWAMAIALLAFFLSCTTGQKDITPKLTDLLITNNERNILLYTRLTEGFNKDTESQIAAGVQKEYILQFKIYEERKYLWNKEIKSGKIRRNIQYDNLKKVYMITGLGDSSPAEFDDISSAQNALADYSGIAVIPISELKKGKKYILKVKVLVEKFRLPFKLERVFFFVSYWDYATKWHKQSFVLK